MLMIGERLRAIRQSKNLSQGWIFTPFAAVGRLGMMRRIPARLLNGCPIGERRGGRTENSTGHPDCPQRNSVKHSLVEMTAVTFGLSAR